MEEDYGENDEKEVEVFRNGAGKHQEDHSENLQETKLAGGVTQAYL